MVAQAGSDLLLKVGDGAATEAFTTVGGIRTTSLTFNKETVDITSISSTGRWRELLAGAGVRSAEMSGAGVFIDDAQVETIRGYFFAETIANYQMIIPDFGTVEGAFEITSMEFAGEYNGEVTQSISLASAGVLTWTAA